MVDIRSYILERFPSCEFNSSGKINTNCPFHEDTTSSFSIREDGLFICGSTKCGIRGNFPLFYKLMEGIVSWSDVFKKLKVVQLATDFDTLFAKQRKGNKEYFVSPFPLSNQVEPIRSIEYLVERGLGQDVIDNFGLLYGIGGEAAGISVDDSIVVPVYDLNGAYLTFQVRYLSQAAKKRWLNPYGSPIQNLLYGGWLVHGGVKDLWIVEGASDVWNLFRFGIQAVGVFTKECTDAQLNRICGLCYELGIRPVVCLDGDAVVTVRGKLVDYGKKIYDELQAYGLSPELIYLKPDEDPGSLSYERLVEIYEMLGGCNETE